MTFFETDRQELKLVSRVIRMMDENDRKFRTEVRASLTRLESRLREDEIDQSKAGPTLGDALESLAQEEALNRKERRGKKSEPVIGPGSRVEREEKMLAERSSEWIDPRGAGLSVRIGILCPAKRTIQFVEADEYKLNDDLPAGTIPLGSDIFRKFCNAVHSEFGGQTEFAMDVQCMIGARHLGRHFSHLWYNKTLGGIRDSINAEWN